MADSSMAQSDASMLQESTLDEVKPHGSRRGHSSGSSDDVEKGLLVVCRVRPRNSKETAAGDRIAVEVMDDQSLRVQGSGEAHEFVFDAVVPIEGTQESVYELAAKPVVEDFLLGFNGTVFAYGQTGSGKTHTMTGDFNSLEHRGILPRMVSAIFDFMEKSEEHMQFMIQVQLLEIYNEQIRDLLNPNLNNLRVVGDQVRGTSVEGASNNYITTEMELLQMMQDGDANRKTGTTNMNQASSRSHSIFTITLEQTNTVDESRKRSKLFMVDLAGSETVKKSGAAGVVLKEAQSINKSLSTLSLVINKLSEGNPKHVPYRDSKLTMILQEALGGNCRTALIINCSPARSNEPETVSTMRFGKSAKKIKNIARINKEVSNAELLKKNAKLEWELMAKDREIQGLREMLANRADGSSMGEKEAGMLLNLDRQLEEHIVSENKAREAEQKMEEQLESLRGQLDSVQSALFAKEEEVVLLKEAAGEPRGGAGPGGEAIETAEERDLKAQILALQERYGAVLEEKMGDAEEWTKDRLRGAEKQNTILLRKAREDARMLQGRMLELQIFDKRLAKAGNRVEILELLLQDTRGKYTKLKNQVQGLPVASEGLGRGKTARPIRGGRKAYYQLRVRPQSEVNSQDDEATVGAVRSFIKDITGNGTRHSIESGLAE
mmetsp:Transcript_47620/g.113372  ORF Transcript_47620/g.113372 Transcript_47620/m.113372 type:complete len:664 (+) Transcript_47620:49-2040(+)